MKKILLFTLLFVSLTASARVRYYVEDKAHLYLRAEPQFDSPIVDTFSSGQYGVPELYIVEDVGNQWFKAEIVKIEYTYNKKGWLTNKEEVSYIRYIDSKSLDNASTSNYKTKYGEHLYLREKKQINSPITDSAYSHIIVIGNPYGEWVKVQLSINTKGEWDTKESFMEYRKYYINVIRYAPREDFVASTELYTVEPPTFYKKIKDKLENIADIVLYNLQNKFDWKDNAPIWVLILLAINIISWLLLTKFPRAQFALNYITMIAIFSIEILYIGEFGHKFWFCRPYYVGWGKAILFFILTLGVLVFQFFKFVELAENIADRSTPFLYSIGTALFSVILVIAFVYAIFSGGLDDDQNQKLINTLLWTQAIQVVFTVIQLRKYPLYALLAAILIPLGVFAILLTFLRLFALLAIAALFILVITGFASSKSSGEGKSSGGGQSTDSGSGGSWGTATNCPHFNSNAMMCDFHKGGRHECGMLNSGRCQHGQK